MTRKSFETFSAKLVLCDKKVSENWVATVPFCPQVFLLALRWMKIGQYSTHVERLMDSCLTESPILTYKR